MPPVGPLGRVLAEMAAAGGIGAALLLGGGRGTGALDCLRAGARRVILLDPDPERLRALRRQAGRTRRLRLHPGVVAERDGTAGLRVQNHAPLSALRAPTPALRALFPGLRAVREVAVDTHAPHTLIGDLPEAGPVPDLLVIDTPGEEAAVLEGLAAAGALHRFGHVVLRCGTAVHYEGSAPLAVLAARLAELGYRMQTPADDAEEGDPDRPWRRFRLEPLALEVAALRERLAAGDAALAQARDETARTRAERDAQARAARALREEMEEQRATLDRLRQETIALRERSTTARDEIRAATEARDALDAQLRTQAAEIERLRRETIAARERADAAVRERMAAEAQAARRHGEKIEALQEDLAMAVRLQALRDADLRDLQARHADLIRDKDRQDALLEQLTERLGLAAQYLRQLDAGTAAAAERALQDPPEDRAP